MSGPPLLLVPERPPRARFSPRERAWHGVQTGLLLLLPLTGFALHFPGPLSRALGFAGAVRWHAALGAALWADVVLGLLTCAAAGRWPGVLSAPGHFTGDAPRLLRYDLFGLWRGAPHPLAGGATPAGRLAGASYASMLLLLLPFQMATGALIGCVNRGLLPAEGFLGLRFLGPAHTLGAYLFAASLLLQIDLATLAPGEPGRVAPRSPSEARGGPGPR